MECNQKMAMRAKELAEEKLRAGDFAGARQHAMKAQQLFPELENLMKLVAVCDVHCGAQNKIGGLENWYGILQLNRFPDEATIKKQYRKLVLLLHPDKNKFAGAEEAFKLIGEAYRLLADPTKRSQYAIKYRIFSRVYASIQTNRKSNTNSDRQHEPANSEGNQKPIMFWTCCEHCGFRCRYLREYINTIMYCSSCQRLFVAVETRTYGVSPRSAPFQFRRKNEVPSQGPGNVPQQNRSQPTGERSGNAPTEMDTIPMKAYQKDYTEVRKPGTEKGIANGDAKVSKAEDSKGAKMSYAEVPKVKAVKRQYEVRGSEGGAAVPKPGVINPKGDKAATVKRKARKMRKIVEELSERFEIDGYDNVGSVKAVGGNNKRSSLRQNRKVSYANSEGNQKPISFVFWTCCEHCEFKHGFLRECMNTLMHCSSCQRSFVAVETGNYDVSPRSAPSRFPRQNEVPNQGRDSVPLRNSSTEPTGGRSGNTPIEMDTNLKQPANSKGNRKPMNFVFWTCCEHCGFRHRFLRECINTLMHCSICQRSFVAVETGNYGVSHRSAPSRSPRQNEVPNQGPDSVPLRNSSAEPTGGRSGNASTEMDTNPKDPANSKGNLKPMNLVWTCCEHCGFRHRFLRVFMNTLLRCSSCQRSFVAVETGNYGVSPRSAPSRFPRQNEVPNQRPDSVPLWNSSAEPTGGQSGNAPTEMDTNLKEPGNSKGNLKPTNIVWTCCEHCGFRRRFLREFMNTLMHCISCQRLFVAVETGTYCVSTRSAPCQFPRQNEVPSQGPGKAEVPKANAVKRRYEVRESEGGPAKPKPNVTNPKGDKVATVKRKARKRRIQIDGFDNLGSVNAADGNNKRSSLRRKQVSYAENGGDDDILSPPTKRSKLHRGFKFDAEGAFPSSKGEKIDNVSEADSENPQSEEFPDPDFSNFDEKKGGFSVNQVWALKDSPNGMPRLYAQIEKVSTAPLRLQMSWLEPLPVTKNEIRIPVSCGKFKSGVTEQIDDFRTFSHQVHCIEQGSHHFIYPQKGETWAVFRDWDVSWSTDPARHKEPYEYEFVEVLTDFMETPDDDNGICGIGVYYLEKVEGFVSLFVRAKHRKVLACIFEPREMCRFSHKVPSFRMTGTEGEGVPPGSFELDPSALPKDIFD
ncbi:PREDICTED: uncharacterized protein LOC104814147 [Tarenaya hassleriana]|uniref:uncharacterized protein LOC104814147 n=1 Tax=Tarenaya hassleriana TaxID=28532 RepID=UPI00053C4821|nr:PREDICTED: uncharacterized protein LOC104814147 [Tarenaya hassleriana]XP_010540335.1 PREDICTED: uncharacterized protein LOC104814147 [Tarenaya hassleriana]XP_010540336.1 PREDICTED: uncharacterized protein LOC104814147 [Tarenaya hassleriana]XP_010540337.1 PREDICTED: uncharacterized protein LOC104814147 [Tarenaya hassleriana]